MPACSRFTTIAQPELAGPLAIMRRLGLEVAKKSAPGRVKPRSAILQNCQSNKCVAGASQPQVSGYPQPIGVAAIYCDKVIAV